MFEQASKRDKGGIKVEIFEQKSQNPLGTVQSKNQKRKQKETKKEKRAGKRSFFSLTIIISFFNSFFSALSTPNVFIYIYIIYTHVSI